MNAVSLLPSEPDGHVETALPWYVNGTLRDAQRMEVERHLSECAQCRASQHLEALLQEQLRSADDSLDHLQQSGWEELAGRLDSPAMVASAAAARARRSVRTRPARLRIRRHLTTLLLLAQAGGIAGLSFALLDALNDRSTASYRTLADPATRLDAALPALPALRVVFADDMTSGTIRNLLEQVGGTIIDGPGSSNIYTVRLVRVPQIDTGGVDQAGDWLRMQSGVLFAETVAATESR